MIFRVQSDLGFTTEKAAKDFFELIKKAKTDKTLKDVSANEKFSANIHKCYHDETPTKPCEIIEKVESEIIVEK